MIQKVNRPQYLSLVAQAKSPENDPGSSQGSGVAYENLNGGSPGQDPSPSNSSDPESPETLRRLSLVVATEQIGMTEVIKDFHENKKEAEPLAGLTSRYSSISGNAKGLLLNKKVE